MTHFIRLTALSLLLSTSTVAVAQETAAPETATEETETPQAEQTDAATNDAAENLGLSMGEEVDQPLAVGAPYISETHGDWAIRCLKAAEGEADPCQLYQLLNDADGNSVAEISMFQLENGGRAAAGATIVVPLETLLTEQLQVAVDGTAKRRYPFTFCNRAGCVARIGFTQEEVNQFKRGNVATVRLVPAAAPTEQVVLNISLTGFTAGYEAVGK